MSSKKYEEGLAVRKSVIGADYVEKSLQNATDFDRPMQELATEYCWGHIWTRPGLSLKERSMINLAMLSALNRLHELEVHVKGALTNGVSAEEIQEIFLQVAVYCGVPVGLESFRVARKVLAEKE